MSGVCVLTSCLGVLALRICYRVQEDNDDTMSLSSSVLLPRDSDCVHTRGMLAADLRQVPGRHCGTEKAGPNVQAGHGETLVP